MPGSKKSFCFVEQHLGAELRIADLARVYGGGLHAFSVAFRRTIGFAPKAYVDRRLLPCQPAGLRLAALWRRGCDQAMQRLFRE